MNKPSSTTKGRLGENIALDYLIDKGYTTIATNYRFYGGEIDIIVQQGLDILVFVEVKSWRSYSIADTEYAIGKRKQGKIRQTAEFFLTENPQYMDFHIRFDLIFLSGKNRDIDHIEEVFC